MAMNEKDVEEARNIIKQLKEEYLLMQAENKKLRQIKHNLHFWHTASNGEIRFVLGEVSHDTILTIKDVLNRIANTEIESHGTG